MMCPECGRKVDDYFDHVHLDCLAMTDEEIAADLASGSDPELAAAAADQRQERLPLWQAL